MQGVAAYPPLRNISPLSAEVRRRSEGLQCLYLADDVSAVGHFEMHKIHIQRDKNSKT